MPLDRTLWATSNERKAFKALIRWDGEDKNAWWAANRDCVPPGWFTADQAMIHIRGGNRAHGGIKLNKTTITETALRRYFKSWVKQGMMETEKVWDTGLRKYLRVYRWAD